MLDEDTLGLSTIAVEDEDGSWWIMIPADDEIFSWELELEVKLELELDVFPTEDDELILTIIKSLSDEDFAELSSFVLDELLSTTAPWLAEAIVITESSLQAQKAPATANDKTLEKIFAFIVDLPDKNNIFLHDLFFFPKKYRNFAIH